MESFEAIKLKLHCRDDRVACLFIVRPRFRNVESLDVIFNENNLML